MILTHSPSSLALARSCKRSWALKYLYKIYPESDLTRGKTLGTLIHAALELYLRGGKLTDLAVETLTQDQAKDIQKYYLKRVNDVGEETANDELATLFREAPQRALAGVHYIPRPDEIEWHDVESSVVIDTTPLIGRVIKFSPRSRIDWVGKLKTGRVKVIDHKSTVGKPNAPWCYVPQITDLLSGDPQLVVYTFYVMQRFGVDEVDFEFVYYYTGEGRPQANNLAFTLERDYIEKQMRGVWLPLCDELQALADQHEISPINIGLLPPPADLVTKQSPCQKFRGCPYKGVQCHPPLVSREQILAQIAPQKKEAPTDMTTNLTSMLSAPPPMGNPTAPPAHVPPVGYATGFPASPLASYDPPPFVPQDAPGVPANTAPAPVVAYGVPLPAGQTVAGNFGPAAAVVAEVNTTLPEPTPPAEKPKRTRRSKAEIEADKNAGKLDAADYDLVVDGVRMPAFNPESSRDITNSPEMAAAREAVRNGDHGTSGTVPTLHTSSPQEAFMWALSNGLDMGGKVTITVVV